MSNAVICISSSEDDDDESVAKNSKVDDKGKRKLSQSLLDQHSKNKRFKSDTGRPKLDSAVVFDGIAKKLYKRVNSSDSETSIQSSKPKEPFNRQNVMVKLPEPIPGTSKSFIETEKKLSDETNKFKLDTESSLSESNKEPPVKRIKPVLVVKNRVTIPDPSDDVFSQFVEACVSHENYDDNDKEDRVILQKIKFFYNELEYSVKTSEEYRLFLNTCTQKIVNKTAKFFKTLVEVQEETKRRARTVKVTISKSDLEKIKVLEDKIKECKKRIKELEEEEINFDDEEDSAYIKADRYKKKLIELCSVLSKLSQDNSLRRKIYKSKITKKDISDEMTGIQSVDQAILDFVNAGINKANKLKHITNPNAIPDCITMPDYLDVLKIIKNKNEENDLELSNRKMEKLAQTAFKAVGKYLKKQRQRETEEFLSSCADTDVQDPALKDAELNLKLKENKCKGEQKLNEVFKFYENKQDGLSPKELEKEKKSDSEIDSESEDDDSNELNQDNKNENEDQIESNVMKKKEEKKTEKNKLEKSKLDLVNVNKKITQEYFSESEQEEKEQNKAKITADTPEKSDVVENLSSSNVKATQNTKNKNDVFKRMSIDSEDIVLEYNSTSEEDPLKIDGISGSNEHSSSTKNKAAQQTNSIREKVLISSNFGKCKVISKNNQNEILTNLKINSSLNEEVVTELKKSINNSISKLDNNVATNNCTTLNSNVNAANKESKTVAEIEHHKSKTDTESSISPDKEKRTNIVYPLQQTKQNSCSNDNCEKTKNFNAKRVVATVIKPYKETIDEDVCIEIDEDVSFKSADVTLKKDTNFSSCDNTDKTSESSFIKVKSFAKPPESWKDSQSPTKKTPNELTTECIVDLTDDEDPLPIVKTKSYTNNKTDNTIINPVAVNNLRPVHNVVVVKNFINNYNVPVKNKGSNLELKSPRDAQRQGGKFNIVKNTNAIIKNFSPSSSNVSPRQHPANLVRKPYSSSSQRKDSK